MNFGAIIEIVSGKSAAHLVTTERQILSFGFGVLMRHQVTAPLSISKGVVSGVIEVAISAHNAAVVKHDDAVGATALALSHFYAEDI